MSKKTSKVAPVIFNDAFETPRKKRTVNENNSPPVADDEFVLQDSPARTYSETDSPMNSPMRSSAVPLLFTTKNKPKPFSHGIEMPKLSPRNRKANFIPGIDAALKSLEKSSYVNDPKKSLLPLSDIPKFDKKQITVQYHLHVFRVIYRGLQVVIGCILLVALLSIFSIYKYIRNRPDVEVCIMGDSLVFDHSDGRIQEDIYGNLTVAWRPWKVTAFSSRHPGNLIANVEIRMKTQVLRRQNWGMAYLSYLGYSTYMTAPDMLILYYDSDCSDKDENDGNRDGLRSTYIDTLTFVLKEMKSRIAFVALAGPTLLGENIAGTNPKDRMLDDYVQINKNISRLYNVTYINTRRAYQKALPLNWTNHAGWLTYDGEHPNWRGMAILDQLFLDVLHKHFDKRTGTVVR